MLALVSAWSVLF